MPGYIFARTSRGTNHLIQQGAKLITAAADILEEYGLEYHRKNADAAVDFEKQKYWLPIDLYIGGAEHAVLHLLYSRFWVKFLHDEGLLPFDEPFSHLFNQGMILAYSYRDAQGKYYHPSDVEEQADGRVLARDNGAELVAQVEKMSKSKLNVVNPDDVIQQYGADAMRLYELFMGPLEVKKPWQMKDVEGVNRFLHRVWRLVVDANTGELNPRLTEAAPCTEPELQRTLHKTIKKVTSDTEALQMNTAIAQMMIFVNEATTTETLPREIVEEFLGGLVDPVEIFDGLTDEELAEVAKSCEEIDIDKESTLFEENDPAGYLYLHQARYYDRATGNHYLFRYDIAAPVTLERKQAAMLPICASTTRIPTTRVGRPSARKPSASPATDPIVPSGR